MIRQIAFAALLAAGLAGCSEQSDLDTQTSRSEQSSSTIKAELPSVPAIVEEPLFDASSLNIGRTGVDASTIKQFEDRFHTLDPQGNPQGVLDRFDELKADADQIFVERAPIHGALLAEKAAALSTLGEQDKASETLKAAKTYFQTPNLQRSNDYLSILSLHANILVQTGDPETGIDILRQAVAIREAGAPADDPSLGQDYLNVAAALYRLSQYEESLQYSQRSVAVSEANLDTDNAGSIDNHVTNLASLSAIANTAGDTDLALSAAEDASTLASAHMRDDNPTLGLALSNYGNALNSAQRYADAEDVLRRAVKARQSQLGEDHERVAITLSNLASALLYQDKFEQAETVFMQSYAILESKGDSQVAWAGMVLDNAAKAASDLGWYDVAADRYDRASELLIKAVGPDHGRIGLSRITHAEALYALGQDEEAIRLADDAVRVTQLAFPETSSYRTLATTTRAFVGAREDAASSLGEVLPILDQLELQFADTRFDQSGLDATAESAEMPLAHIAEIAARADRPDVLLRTLQLASLGSVSESDQRAVSRAFESDPELSDLYRELTRDKARRLTLEADLSEALADGRDTDVTNARAEIEALKNAIVNKTDRLTAKGGSATLAFRILGEDQLRAFLGPREALLIISATHRPKSILILPEETHIHIEETISSREMRAALATLRRKLENREAVIASDPALLTLTAILSPSAAQPLANINSLKVVDAGIFSTFPITLLPDPSNPDRFLGERVAISYLPSAANIERKRAKTLGRNAKFLGIGDPVLAPVTTEYDYTASIASLPTNGVYLRGGVADAMRLRTLPSLPGTRAELEGVSQSFSKSKRTLMMGADASEAALRRMDLSDYSVITFATHGLLPGEAGNGREPALVLTPPETAVSSADDGLLTADEISQLSFNDPLVILSACNTAAAGRSGRALTGLPSAFYAAGASQLMISHWPVRDDAAAFLSTRTLSYMKEGITIDEALRRAMAELRSSDLPGADHPAIWAPFVIVGG